MLIPFITAAVLWFGFKRQTKWWEFLIPFGASIILACILHLMTSFVSAQRPEYWTGWITDASYYEAWNEKVYYNVEVEDGYKSVKGSDGKYHKVKKYKTVRKSRIDEHGPEWEAKGSNGESYSISSSVYKDFVRRWGNEQFTELHRDYYNRDGDKYSVRFNGIDKDMEVITTIHSYENRVVVSRSVFNFKPVDPKAIKAYSLIEYPSISDKWEAPSVFGANVPGFSSAEKKLAIFNAKYGASKQVRVFLLIFKEQPLEAAYQQQSYWKNGNMNEFAICVGVDKDNKVEWGHAFSWTDVSALPIEARDMVNDQRGKTTDLSKVIAWVDENIPSRWERKNFKKDFSYISIAPPWWAVLIAFVLTAALNVGLSFWITQNEFTDEEKRTY